MYQLTESAPIVKVEHNLHASSVDIATADHWKKEELDKVRSESLATTANSAFLEKHSQAAIIIAEQSSSQQSATTTTANKSY